MDGRGETCKYKSLARHSWYEWNLFGANIGYMKLPLCFGVDEFGFFVGFPSAMLESEANQ